MKISFHGAAQCVTGSKHLITLKNGKRILLDCGLFQGMGRETDPMNRDFGFEPDSISVMILSHAHIDHCGLIPRLSREGYRGAIFCTPATKELAGILLEDSAEIQENDLRYLNKKRKLEGRELLTPLYTPEDAKRCMEQFQTVNYGEWVNVEEGVECLFTDTGHIIGSAAVHLRITENGQTRTLTFSGDVGRYRDIILRSPETFPPADFIVLESTYGNSRHDPTVDTHEVLLNWIVKTCLQKKGKLIIPAFSVGRTQEILYALNQLENENRLPPLDYFVDSPLSYEATQLLKNYPQYFNSRIQKVMRTDADPFAFRGLKFVRTADESKLLNYRKEPCVIISASGMAEAGRVKHHISNNIENSRNTILLVGYCEPHSLGGRLKKHPEEVGIFGMPHQVNAEIGEMRSMSAHGDYDDLCQWLSCQNPEQVKTVFLVHGEPEVQEDLQKSLLRKGFPEVEIPYRHQEFGLG